VSCLGTPTILRKRNAMAESFAAVRARTSVSRRPVAIDVDVIGGAVAPVDQAYAREQVGYLSRHSSRAVQCGRVHLCASVDDAGRSIAAVDALVVFDDAVVICAGAVSATVREAIDQLSSRLRRRLPGEREREWSWQPRSYAGAAGVSP
jgi:hypothetical protein